MTAYISLSYSKRKELDEAIHAIKATLQAFSILPFVFVDEYHFTKADERQMMQQAAANIDCCDLLIAETSDKGIGIGIEAGYAKAKGKPVIYVRQENAEHSTTVAGISDFQIIYQTASDLQRQLALILSQLQTQK